VREVTKLEVYLLGVVEDHCGSDVVGKLLNRSCRAKLGLNVPEVRKDDGINGEIQKIRGSEVLHGANDESQSCSKVKEAGGCGGVEFMPT
jgi:hypothetical protein